MRFIFILLFVLTTLFCPDLAAKPAPQAWIIDTDAGLDDATAILYLLNQAQTTVKAITLEGNGLTRCKPAFRNITALLKLAGHPEIPVACGRDTPLSGGHRFPVAVRRASEQQMQALLPHTSIRPPTQTAKELMMQTLTAAAQPVNILAIGPLTTLAEVIMQNPGLKKKIGRIDIMGGAIQVRGNIQTVLPKSANSNAEWNFYLDPRAADQVLHAGLAVTLVPLDVTNQAWVDDEFYRWLEKERRTAAAEFVYGLLRLNKKDWIQERWSFWDPMAAVLGVNEGLASCEVVPLVVVQRPETKAGTTIVDVVRGEKVRVCMQIGRAAFEKKFLEGLNACDSERDYHPGPRCCHPS